MKGNDRVGHVVNDDGDMESFSLVHQSRDDEFFGGLRNTFSSEEPTKRVYTNPRRESFAVARKAKNKRVAKARRISRKK